MGKAVAVTGARRRMRELDFFPTHHRDTSWQVGHGSRAERPHLLPTGEKLFWKGCGTFVLGMCCWLGCDPASLPATSKGRF